MRRGKRTSKKIEGRPGARLVNEQGWSKVRRDVRGEIQKLVSEGLAPARIESRLAGKLNWAERDYARLLAGVRDSLRNRSGPGGPRPTAA